MESFITDNKKYRIESLSPTTFPGAQRVIKEALCQDECVCVGTEVNKNPQAVEEMLELSANAALDGVSLVAVEVSTEEVVSVIFNKIQTQTTDASEKSYFEIFAEERCSQPSSRELIKFMADVDGRCNFFNKFNIDCSFELMFLATLREHRKQRLATMLCKYSIDIARKIKDVPIAPIQVKDLGPKYSHLQPRKLIESYPKICHAIWTTEGSQKIGKVLNFTVVLRVPYSEFVFDGKLYSDRIGVESAICEVAYTTL